MQCNRAAMMLGYKSNLIIQYTQYNMKQITKKLITPAYILLIS